MGKEAKTNAMRILERAKVPYTAHEYAHEEGVAVDGVTVAATQSNSVRGVITFGFVGLEVFAGIILAVLLIFLNVEKDIGKKQAEIKARREAKE